jgi:hypothetical protein
MEFGLYDADENLIEIETLSINDSSQKLKFSTTTRPSKIVIAPNLLLTEQDIENTSTASFSKKRYFKLLDFQY